jgi:hypothetical protein
MPADDRAMLRGFVCFSGVRFRGNESLFGPTQKKKRMNGNPHNIPERDVMCGRKEQTE